MAGDTQRRGRGKEVITLGVLLFLAQKKNEEAAQAAQRFHKAWVRADVKLTASRF
jgi:hypothetical protein